MKRFVALAVFTGLALPSPALACSICGGDFRTRPTLRQEAGAAKFVVYGKLANPKLEADPTSGTGSTDLKIEKVLKGGDRLAVGGTVRIPRFLPADAKGQALAFFDLRDGKLEFLGIRTTSSDALAGYLANSLALPAGNMDKLHDFCHRQLDHADADVAADAFLELAKATDADVGRTAKSFDPDRLRRLLNSNKTPSERIGFLGFLLGCCGNERDADLLLKLMKTAPADNSSAMRGLMAGYIGLKPKEGWKKAIGIITDSHRGFLERLAILGTIEFYWDWKPAEHRDALLFGMKAAVLEGDVADIAVDNLRRWGCWDLTKNILSLYDRKSHDSEFVKRAILRYASACPQPEAAKFVADQRKRTPGLVAEIEEAMREEKAMK